MSHHPAWPALRILHEDADLVAIDKPAGLPTIAPDREWGPRALGAVELLERQLHARSGELRLDMSLGVHQRLDRDTSGVLIFSKSEAGAARLARAFEERLAEKRYVAAVEGWFSGDKELVHYLAPDAGGSQVVKKKHPRAKRAVCYVNQLARHGRRSLVRVRLETGRTHQIRVQLAEVGAPIAGDLRYGDTAAHRLLLHAEELVLPAEKGAPALRLQAPVPASFERWVAGEMADRLPRDDAELDGLIAAAAPRRYGLSVLGWPHRFVAGAADGLPGVVVDRYDDADSGRSWFLLGLYGDDACAREDALADALVGHARRAESERFGGVYVVRRPRQANLLGDDHRALAPAEPIRGGATGAFSVREDGLRYQVELGAGLQTLFFLDQRDARRRVRAAASGRRVLNLFCYTGSFSIAAGAGGASFVQSVDAAGPALDVLRRNLEINDLSGPGHSVIKEDVFRFLPRLDKRGERFDLIICDPPTYAKTKHTRWKSGAQWVELARQVLGLLTPGGSALLCSNDFRMSEAEFIRHVHEGARHAGVDVRVRTQRDPVDLPVGVAARGSHAGRRHEGHRSPPKQERRVDTSARDDTVANAGRGPWRVWVELS